MIKKAKKGQYGCWELYGDGKPSPCKARSVAVTLSPDNRVGRIVCSFFPERSSVVHGAKNVLLVAKTKDVGLERNNFVFVPHICAG